MQEGRGLVAVLGQGCRLLASSCLEKAQPSAPGPGPQL